MMYWWGWMLVFFFFAFVIGIMVLWFGFVIYVKVALYNPKILGIFIDETKKVKKKCLINFGMFSTEWKKNSINPDYVEFDARPDGIGKKIPMRWRADDFIELDFEDNKKFILFGLQNFDFKISLQIKTLKKMLNVSLADGALLEQKYRELQVKMDDKVKDRLDEIKKAMPVVINPKGQLKK